MSKSGTEVLTQYLREHLQDKKFRTDWEMRSYVAGLLDNFSQNIEGIWKMAKDHPEQFVREFRVEVESFRE